MKLELDNLQAFCRTCLDCLQSTAETLQTASVKNYDIRETPDLTKMLIICTALGINEDVDMMYPQCICSKCYLTLLEFKRFREIAIKSQEILHGIVENGDGEFIVERDKSLPEKSGDATAEKTVKHFEVSKPKLSDSYDAIPQDETEPAKYGILNKNMEIENMMMNDAPLFYDNQTRNGADIKDGSGVVCHINPSSSKTGRKRKRIAGNDNEELFQSADSSNEVAYNSNESFHKHWKKKESVTDEAASNAETRPLDYKEIKAKIINGDFKIEYKRGRSKVWNIFGTVTNEIGDEIDGVVACKSCLNIYKVTRNSTSNLVRHKCYSSQNTPNMQGDIASCVCVDSECKKRGVRAFTLWTLKNCRTYKIVQDSGFLNIAQYLVSIGVKYGQNVYIPSALPDPTTISRNVENLYGVTLEKVKSEINLIKDIGFGLTSDIWTDNYLRKSYISLTMHYIQDGSLITRLLGLQSMEPERCTHENIHNKVRNMLMEFNCDLNKKAIIVTNRGSNMVGAFDTFQHIFCISHLINNAVEKAMEEVSALKNLCGICFDLKNYLKESGIYSSIKSTPKSYCKTCWNTTYYLLKLIQQNWSQIKQILQEKKELHLINNINLSQLQGIITILEPFEETLKKLEEENYPTIHLTLMHIHHLLKKCSPEFKDQIMEKEFKERLRINLESTVIKNLSIYHKMALFLFPPTNKMIQFDEDDKQLVRNECKLIMRIYQSEIRTQRQSDESIPLSVSIDEIVADHIQSPQVINEDFALDQELLTYEQYKVMFHDNFDILHWWHQNKKEFPLLFKVTCKILATPASSAPSKRIFSLARNLISEKELHISTNMNSINQIMFVNVNIGKDNILAELNSIL